MTLTFINMYNIRVPHGRHDLHLSPYADQVSLGFYLAFLYGFDGDFLTRLLVDAKLNFPVRALT